ncbi:MAG: hypothetical protein A2266_10720 [Bacteroidetes bacterium RIFOXYA12_FULL_40_10]|nr:MAG: hypothetical protein A2266_10720 [Bacteroidetes bacterium RIFOXYA12_FULL_40_10]
MEINLKSVFTTGLVAGLVISLSAISMVPVVGNEMDVVLASRGVPPLSNLAMVFFCSISFFSAFLLSACMP